MAGTRSEGKECLPDGPNLLSGLRSFRGTEIAASATQFTVAFEVDEELKAGDISTCGNCRQRGVEQERRVP